MRRQLFGDFVKKTLLTDKSILGLGWKGNSGRMSLSWNDRTNSTSRQNPSKVIRIHSTNLNPADIRIWGGTIIITLTGKLLPLISKSLPFRTQVSADVYHIMIKVLNFILLHSAKTQSL